MPFHDMFPLCAALHLPLVGSATANHPGYDEEELEVKLGPERFAKLQKSLTEVFCCGHRHYAADHPTRAGCEVHCIWAKDLEKFLQAGG
jgi:hypothetical protein